MFLCTRLSCTYMYVESLQTRLGSLCTCSWSFLTYRWKRSEMEIFSVSREQISHWIGMLFQQLLTTSGTGGIWYNNDYHDCVVDVSYLNTLQRSLQQNWSQFLWQKRAGRFWIHTNSQPKNELHGGRWWGKKKRVMYVCVLLRAFARGGKKKSLVIPPGIEPGTLSVLDSRDNRYTTESLWRYRCESAFLLLLQMARAVGNHIQVDPMLLQFFKPQL